MHAHNRSDGVSRTAEIKGLDEQQWSKNLATLLHALGNTQPLPVHAARSIAPMFRRTVALSRDVTSPPTPCQCENALDISRDHIEIGPRSAEATNRHNSQGDTIERVMSAVERTTVAMLQQKAVRLAHHASPRDAIAKPPLHASSHALPSRMRGVARATVHAARAAPRLARAPVEGAALDAAARG